MADVKHNCKRWTFHAGMATCEHGFELLPDGDVRKPSVVKWKSHRTAIATSLSTAKARRRSH